MAKNEDVAAEMEQCIIADEFQFSAQPSSSSTTSGNSKVFTSFIDDDAHNVPTLCRNAENKIFRDRGK